MRIVHIHFHLQKEATPAKLEPTTREQKGWFTQGLFCSLITRLSAIRLSFVIFSRCLFFTDSTGDIWVYILDYCADTEVK
jgi:hypothetical protein